jgi:hypothetical protein
MIIGIVGLIGSGKSTVGDYLKNDKGYRQVAFAGANKDVTAAVFGWDRALLEGDTKESREFREKEDLWWSLRLGESVTPRKMLQKIGHRSYERYTRPKYLGVFLGKKIGLRFQLCYHRCKISK